MNSQNGEVYYGAYDNFNDNTMTTSAPAIALGNHVNNEMWAYTHHDEAQWVELGIRQGYFPGSPGTCGGVPCAYGRFWADFDTGGNEHRHIIAFASPTGANHTYEILRDTTTTTYWDVYVDFNFVGQSTSQNSANLWEIQAGLEDSDPTPDTHADTFDHSPLQYETIGGTLVTWPYMESWVDYPCGPSNPSGYCLNAQQIGTDRWLDNKP